MQVLIVSGNLGATILEWRKHIKGINRCRLVGKLRDGSTVRIVPYHLVDRWIENKRYREVVWSHCTPTDLQAKKADSCLLTKDESFW